MFDTDSRLLNLASPDILLEAVYERLDYSRGELFEATSQPSNGSKESFHWVDKGEWLSLAEQINASKVLFVNNDPVFIFYKFDHAPSGSEVVEVLRLAWNMARPQRIFIATDGELNVYSLNQSPSRDIDDWRILASIRSASEVLENLRHYHRSFVETYVFLEEDEKRFGSENHRADWQLIRDLARIRNELIDIGVSPEVAHALIGRSIFIRYLEDRRILLEDDFYDVAGQNVDWRKLLDTPPEKPVVYENGRNTPILYERVLRDKDFAFALFEKLQEDFNGDMFPISPQEKSQVRDNEPFQLLRQFLFGDTDMLQERLFFWAYSFDVIPIELISSIYEEFYHLGITDDDKGTHYTPSSLVSFVLSEVLTEEVLDTHPRVLDPACGSGIFLVESYRRMVRHWCKNNPAGTLSPQTLRNILREQICGVEINTEAAHIAAFSLCLALLHYQDPPAIREHRLPVLIHGRSAASKDEQCPVIFNTDVFGLTEEERVSLQARLEQNGSFAGRIEVERILEANVSLDLPLHSFDIIVGNPPWEQLGESTPTYDCSNLPVPSVARGLPRSIVHDHRNRSLGFKEPVLVQHVERAKQILPIEYVGILETIGRESNRYFQAERWAKAFHKVVGDKNLSQYFVHRCLALVKKSGAVALLVHVSTIFNSRKTSQEFRKQWLEQCQLIQVFNFTAVRGVFFERAIAPFALIHFSPRQLGSVAGSFIYTSASDKELTRLSKSVILTKYDRRIVDQEAIISRDSLWKTYWWGNHQDERLLRRLEMNPAVRSLAQVAENQKPLAGFGFQRGSDPPKGVVATMKPLCSEHIVWYGPIQSDWFEEIPSGTKRDPSHTLYTGQRLLAGKVQRGGPVVRLEYDTFPFRHLLYSIPLSHLSAWQAKVIVGVFWSRVGKYRMFLTATNWGTWHDKLIPDDILSMPVPLPNQQNEITARIVDAVDKIRSWSPGILEEADQSRSAEIGDVPDPLFETMQILNENVYRLFGLRSLDTDLIDDFYEYTFDHYLWGSASRAKKRVQTQLTKHEGSIGDIPDVTHRSRYLELEAYLSSFLEIWNKQLEPVSGELHWLIIRSNGRSLSKSYPPFLAAVFTTQFKSDRESSEFSKAYSNEWQIVMNQLASELRQPISKKIYVDGMVRAVSDTSIVVIKRDESQFWTRSRAREDAEATMLQVMNLNQALAR